MKEETEKEEKTIWHVNQVRIGHMISRFDDYQTFVASNTTDCFRLHFGLKGDYMFKYLQINKSFDLCGGHHNLIYSKGIDLEVTNKTLLIETFGIDFPKDVFINLFNDAEPDIQKFLEKSLQGKSEIFSQNWGSLTPKIQSVIDEILLNPYAGTLQKIFLWSKSLELLILCIDNYRQSDSNSIHVKTQADKEKIIAARDYINQNLNNPPSLSEVANAVGLNEFKLKHGFKEVFQSTLFNYMQEKRLTMAKSYLMDKDRSISEIAYDLGYSSPQHFNLAFKKKFLTPPKEFRNKTGV